MQLLNNMERQSQYLPNWEDAQIHGRAAQVGQQDELDNKTCHCCHQKIQKKLIPICENTKTLQFLGFGFPLFYVFIRNCIILLLLLIISNSCISLYISVQDGNNYCNSRSTLSTPEVSDLTHFMSNRQFNHQQEEEPAQDPNMHLTCKCRNFMLLMARTDKQQKDYEVVFRVCSFVIHLLCLLYIKDKIIKTCEYYDEVESDISDYAVLVKGLPRGITGVRQKIRNIFTDEASEGGKIFQIYQIILIPQAKTLHDLNQEEEKAIKTFLQAKGNGQGDTHFQLQKLQKISNDKKQQVQRMMELIYNDKVESQNAIIIFLTEPEKAQFLQMFNQGLLDQKIQKQFNNSNERLIIVEAPQPREIIYDNLPYERDRTKNIMIGWGLSLLFLVAITIVFYSLQLVKTNNLVSAIEQEQKNPVGARDQKLYATIIAWVTLLSIVFFNKFVMSRVLHWFTHLEKHDNRATQNFSFAFKYAIGMFFTTAIMTILVEALKYHNYYKHDFGVIQEETIMFFLCAFMAPAIWLINPLQLCHIYDRWKHYGKNDVSQRQANYLMADYHYDMGKRYAQIIQKMWFTFLYADLIPIGAFLMIVGLGVYYWVDKYNLLRRSSLEGNISGDLAKKALSLLDLTLFWRFLGELIFDVQIRNGATNLNLIFLGLSVIYMLIPWDSLLGIINYEHFKPNDKKYTDQNVRFANDSYKQYHPVYSNHPSTQETFTQEHYLANDIFLFAKNLIKDAPDQSNPFLNLLMNVKQPQPPLMTLESQQIKPFS